MVRMSGARALNMPLGIICRVYGVVLHQRGMCRNVREEEFSKGLGFYCCYRSEGRSFLV